MSVITITAQNFETEVTKETKPVLVDFWAEWCMPCRMMSPVIDELAEQMPQVKVGKVNVDEQGALAEQFQVMSIPTLLFFKDGQVVKKLVGVQDEQEVKQILEQM